MHLTAHWIGRQSYDDAHARQIEIRDRVASGDAEATLLLLEHDPVVTFGRRGEGGDLLVSRDRLEERGIAIRSAERGGRTTYHGPGQLVGYLIAQVRRLAPDLPTYVWRLEEALIATVADFGIQAGRDDRNHGVWVGEAKLGAIGIAVHRGVCWHGFALNVDPNLETFSLIRPCGLDLEPTSLARLGVRVPSVEDVARIAAREIAGVLHLTLLAD